MGASRRRLIAAARCEPHEWSSYPDPLCDPPKPELTVDSYARAAQHLIDRGLCPHLDTRALRTLWRRGGADRVLAMRLHQLTNQEAA
jgi:hypothetical protein